MSHNGKERSELRWPGLSLDEYMYMYISYTEMYAQLNLFLDKNLLYSGDLIMTLYILVLSNLYKIMNTCTA